MQKIKVVRIIARMNIGGPAIQAALLTGGLDNDRFSSILVTGQPSENEGDMSYLVWEKGIEPLVIPEMRREVNPLRDIVSFYKLYKFLRRERPDVVHTHTAKAGAIGRLAARTAGVPVVIHTFHGHIFHSYFGAVSTGCFLLIERFLSRITDKVIVVSNIQKDEIQRYLRMSESKIALIPLGFDLGRFLNYTTDSKRDSIREELGISRNATVVAIVGRLTSIKNHRMFLEVAREIKRQRSSMSIKFLIVGDGELRSRLLSLSETLGIGRDVVFAGWRRDMEDIYYASDIVALTSLNEGTPVSIIEALASGKAVVATDAGGVRDIVRDGVWGFVVAKNDVGAFAERVLTLLDDGDKRTEFGRRGRDFVKRRHSKERLIYALQELYREQLEKKLKR